MQPGPGGLVSEAVSEVLVLRVKAGLASVKVVEVLCGGLASNKLIASGYGSEGCRFRSCRVRYHNLRCECSGSPIRSTPQD